MIKIDKISKLIKERDEINDKLAIEVEKTLKDIIDNKPDNITIGKYTDGLHALHIMQNKNPVTERLFVTYNAVTVRNHCTIPTTDKIAEYMKILMGAENEAEK